MQGFDRITFPYLQPDDVEQALRYAAWLTEENVYRLAPTST